MLPTRTEIKLIRSLKEKKFRDGTGLFVVEGEKMVREALDSPFRVERVFRKDEIGEAAMARISGLSSAAPALALVRKPDDLLLEEAGMEKVLGKRGLFLALDGIRDPGNLGTILRIADWFGLDAVFASRGSVEVFNPKVVQATMGAIFRVRFRYCDIPALCRKAVAAGGKAYGTFLDGEDLYARKLETGTDAPAVIVIGNESAGISPDVEAAVSARLCIPSFPPEERGSESLNAAVAAAVAGAGLRRRG